MLGYSGYHYLRSYLHEKYSEKDWFEYITGYLMFRFPPIEDRLIASFRYVDPHYANKDVFSYEYASLLRDVGSVFGSVLDCFLRNSTGINKEYNIRDYRRFLINEVSDIQKVGASLRIPLSKRLIFPFEEMTSVESKLCWWNAYNDIKHSDIYEYSQGCLCNVLYALSALAILYTLMDPSRSAERKLFQIGFFIDVSSDVIFPYK